jgi:hypothetical protein
VIRRRLERRPRRLMTRIRGMVISVLTSCFRGCIKVVSSDACR